MREISSASFFIIGLFVFSTKLAAQKLPASKKYWSYGVNINATNYAGDLDPINFPIAPALRYTRYNFGLHALYKFRPRAAWRANVSYGRIMGNDRTVQSSTFGSESFNRYIRGANFRTDLYEFKLDVVYDLKPNFERSDKRMAWVPYVAVGLAFFYMDPKTNIGEGYKSLKNELPQLRFSNYQVAIPLSFGVKYKLTNAIDIGLEICMRKSFTGYLDGVKGPYIDPFQLNESQRQYNNPAMIGYGSNTEVTQAINRQGIVVYDLESKAEIATLQSENAENLLATAGIDSRYVYATPRDFGLENQKKGEFYDDWYYTLGIHLSYILQPKVNCPVKFYE